MRHSPGLAFTAIALLSLAAGDAAFAAGAAYVDDTKGESFITRRAALSHRIESSVGMQQARALVEMAEFYMGRGFVEEAYANLTRLAADHPDVFAVRHIKDMAKIAFILSGQTEDPYGLRDHQMADPRQDALWRAVAAAKARELHMPPDLIRSALAVIDSYPEVYKREILPLLFEAALDAGEAVSARAIAEVIAAQKDPILEEDCETWLVGRLAELEGHPDAARRRYGTAAAFDSRCGAGAKLELLDDGIAADSLAAEAVMKGTGEIAEKWPGTPFEERALWLRARFQKKQGDAINALKTLRLQTERFPNGALLQDAQSLGAELFSRLMTDGIEAFSPEQVRRLRQDYMPFVTDRELARQIDRRYADYLAERGFYAEAADILATTIPSPPTDETSIANLHGTVLWYMLRPEARADALKLVEMLVKGGRPKEAIDRLGRIVNLEQPETWGREALQIYVEAKAALGELDTVIGKIDHLLDRHLTREIAKIYMKAEKWEAAFFAYDELLQMNPDAAHGAPDYVDYAIAAYLSGYMEEAAGLLEYRASAWAGSEWSSLIASLIRHPERAAENNPEQAIAELLDQTESLIALGKTVK